MLIHEALARSRQREAVRAAADYRRARRLTAGPRLVPAGGMGRPPGRSVPAARR